MVKNVDYELINRYVISFRDRVTATSIAYGQFDSVTTSFRINMSRILLVRNAPVAEVPEK